MENGDLPARSARFAQKFSLIPPPRDKRLRVEFAKARAARRRAEERLYKVLAMAPSTAEANTRPPRVDPVELARAWSSPRMVSLRAGLDGEAQEKLHVWLEALIAGKVRQESWLKILSLAAEDRSITDRLREAWAPAQLSR